MMGIVEKLSIDIEKTKPCVETLAMIIDTDTDGGVPINVVVDADWEYLVITYRKDKWKLRLKRNDVLMALKKFNEQFDKENYG